MVGLLPEIEPARKTSASGCHTYSTLAIDDRIRHLITKKPAPPTCNCGCVRKYTTQARRILHENSSREDVHRLLRIIAIRPKPY